jgi:hypothetical protein
MQYYEVIAYYAGDIYVCVYIYIYIYMHMIYRVIIIIQQYGQPKILPILSKVDAVPRDL